MIPIKDNYKFGTDPTMEDQIRRTNNWIYKTKKSILDHPLGPMVQQIEALNKKSLMKPDTFDFKSLSTFPATTIAPPLSSLAFK